MIKVTQAKVEPPPITIEIDSRTLGMIEKILYWRTTKTHMPWLSPGERKLIDDFRDAIADAGVVGADVDPSEYGEEG